MFAQMAVAPLSQNAIYGLKVMTNQEKMKVAFTIRANLQEVITFVCRI